MSEKRHYGPFFGRTGDFIAYIVAGAFATVQTEVCLVTFREDADSLVTNLDSVFDSVMEQISERLENWQKFSYHTAVLQRGLKSMHLSTYEGRCTEPEQVAHEILEGLIQHGVLESSGFNFAVKVYETDPKTGLTNYTVQPEASPNIYHLSAKSLDDVRIALPDFMKSISAFAKEYLRKCLGAIEKAQMREAFRYFFHALAIEKDAQVFDTDLYIEIALELAQRLRESYSSDHAELVASTAAKLASERGQAENAAIAYQLAGIAASDLGWVDETRSYYELAIKHLDQSVPKSVAASVHMSYGLSLVSLLAHTDFDPDENSGAAARLSAALATAESHLQVARSLLDTDSHRERRLAAIDLDLARISDLRGHSEDALRLLESLALTGLGHIATHIVYRLAALRHRAQADPRFASEYSAGLAHARKELVALPFCPPDRACWYFVAAGEMAIAGNQRRDAVEAFRRAQKSLQPVADRILRAPGSTVSIGGVFAIDIVGRLQQALVSEIPEQDTSPDDDWQAFACADGVKSGLFLRDLAIADGTVANSSVYSLHEGKGIQDRLVGGTVDPRIALADYESFLEQHAAEQGNHPNVSASPIRGDVQRQEVSALLEKTGCSTIILSLYCTRRGTIAYILSPDRTEPEIFVIDIDKKSLANAARYLVAGIQGDEFNPSIDPHDPDKNAIFFRPFLELRSRFEDLLPVLRGAQLLLVNPHDLWYALPLPVILLPLFWKENLCPGIAVVPSVRMATLLQRRASDPQRVRRRSAVLTTVPSLSDREQEFLKTHEAMKEVFQSAGLPVDAAYGKDATPDKVTRRSGRGSLQHVIAHGRFEAQEDSMCSAMLLSDGSSLPSRDIFAVGEARQCLLTAREIMATAVAPPHTTLQACSLGRHTRGARDELWGMTRAILAGGGSSVIAPHWDVDMNSSTQLLASFYRKWLSDGMSKPCAFTHAQRQLSQSIEKSEWTHFYHWGAFQYFGW